MNLRQIALVQAGWKEVLLAPDVAARLFYARLFSLDPSLAPLFNDDLRDQGRKLVAMISVAVNGLSRLETLSPVIEALGRHANNYGTVAAALLWTIEQVLGRGFTAEMKEAWLAAKAEKQAA